MNIGDKNVELNGEVKKIFPISNLPSGDRCCNFILESEGSRYEITCYSGFEGLKEGIQASIKGGYCFKMFNNVPKITLGKFGKLIYESIDAPKTRVIKTKIVGQTFLKTEEYLKTLKPNDVLEVVPLLDNKNDPNAKGVIHKGKQIGFLNRELAADLNSKEIISCVVENILGGDKGNIGCNIMIEIIE